MTEPMKNNVTFSPRRKGFSKLEVLVLGSMATLCAVWLWPVAAQTGDDAESARATSCQSNLKQIALGMEQYVQDYDEMFPAAALDTGKSKAPYGWADVIAPYIRSSQLLQCPSERHTDIVGPTQSGYTDYWFNRNVAHQSLARMNEVSNTFMFGDGDGGSPASTSRYALNALPGSWLTTPHSPARRHLEDGNYAFADGHVKRLPATVFSNGGARPYTFAVN